MSLSDTAPYADANQFQTLGVPPADYERFETLSPGSSAAALQAASGEANSYLAGQFTMPLQSWDSALVRAVCWMAAKYQFDLFGYNPGAPADASIEKRYEQAVSWLSEVRDKKLYPQYVDSSTATPASGPFVLSSPSVFGDGCWPNWGPHNDWF